MSKVVELVTAWADFDRQYPDQSVEQFCQYYLAQQKQNEPNKSQARKQLTGGLLRLMGRITSAFALYHRAAMAKTDLPNAESFFYLNGLNFLGEVRKTELINYLFAEYTTGMEALSRLIDEGYILERPDPTDKRAKLIKLSEKGTKRLATSYEYSSRAGELIFNGFSNDTIALCQTLLKPIEERHTQLVSTIKTKDFDLLYEQIMNKNEKL